MLRMLPTKTSLDFAANVSPVSLPPSHADTDTHTQTSMLAGAPFASAWLILPSFCLWIGGLGERGRADGEESCEAKRLVT